MYTASALSLQNTYYLIKYIFKRGSELMPPSDSTLALVFETTKEVDCVEVEIIENFNLWADF